MKDKKKQTDLDPVIVNKEDHQNAGYGGRNIPPNNETIEKFNKSGEEE